MSKRTITLSLTEKEIDALGLEAVGRALAGELPRHERRLWSKVASAIRASDSIAKIEGLPQYATIAFSIVPHGWQCDAVVKAKSLPVAKGTVCRDWSDSGPSAKRFIERLIRMGETGR